MNPFEHPYTLNRRRCVAPFAARHFERTRENISAGIEGREKKESFGTCPELLIEVFARE
jgi:hypothetical protein